MADPQLGQVAATVWENVIGKTPTDNIFTSRALFFALGEKGFKEEAGGGRLFEFTLEFNENGTFKSYGEDEQLDTTRYNVFDASRWEWKTNAGTVTYSELERLRAQAASGKTDLIEEKLENGKDSHIASMNRQMFSDGTGNSSKNIAGLQHIIATAPTSGTVGGINRATFSFHRNRQNSGAKSSTAFDNLRSAATTTFNQCSDGGLENTPTAAVTNQTVFEGLESLTVAVERYVKDSKEGQGFNVGFMNRAFMFKGIPVFYDEDAPSGNLYFVNPKFLKMVYLKGGWMKMYPAVDPANQLANVHKVATFGNMGTNCSRRLGVVSSIT